MYFEVLLEFVSFYSIGSWIRSFLSLMVSLGPREACFSHFKNLSTQTVPLYCGNITLNSWTGLPLAGGSEGVPDSLDWGIRCCLSSAKLVDNWSEIHVWGSENKWQESWWRGGRKDLINTRKREGVHDEESEERVEGLAEGSLFVTHREIDRL